MREIHVLKMREAVDDVTAALVQEVPVELREHFDMLKADFRIHKNTDKVNYN